MLRLSELSQTSIYSCFLSFDLFGILLFGENCIIPKLAPLNFELPDEIHFSRSTHIQLNSHIPLFRSSIGMSTLTVGVPVSNPAPAVDHDLSTRAIVPVGDTLPIRVRPRSCTPVLLVIFCQIVLGNAGFYTVFVGDTLSNRFNRLSDVTSCWAC